MSWRYAFVLLGVSTMLGLWACVGDDPVATPGTSSSGGSSGAAEDAAVDALPDVSAPSFCVGRLGLFCSDFTLSSPLGQGWNPGEKRGGSGTLVRLDGRLQASVEAADPEPRQAFAYLEQTVDIAQRRAVRVEVSLTLDPQSAPQAGDVEIVSFRRSGDDVGWCLTRKGSDAGATYVLQAERITGGWAELPIACPEGRETRLQVDLTFGADKLSYTCDLGTQQPVETARPTGPVSSESATLRVGLTHALQGQVPLVRVSYDDVLVSEQ